MMRLKTHAADMEYGYSMGCCYFIYQSCFKSQLHFFPARKAAFATAVSIFQNDCLEGFPSAVLRSQKSIKSTQAFTYGNFLTGETGYSVDIAGEVAIIGAPAGGGGSDIGLVTFAKNYNKNTGVQAYQGWTISLNDALNTRLGESTAIAFVSSDFYYGFSEAFGTLSGSPYQFAIQYNADVSTLNFTPSDYESIGTESESMSATDQFVAIGNVNETVRMYVRTNNTTIGTPQTLTGPGGSGFGKSVAVYGNYLAVGAPTAGSRGRVYIYKYDGSSWNNLEQIIEKPVLNYYSPDDNFGTAVGMYGDYLIVGAPDHIDEDGSTSGEEGIVFFFKMQGGAFEFIDFGTVGDPSDAESGEEFGFSVDVYTIAAAEKDEDIYVESVLRACPSDRTHYTLKVDAPYAVYQVDKPSEQLLTGDTVSFDLSTIDEEYEYLWDFGDGQSSREAEPRHAYDKAGTYFVKLRVQDQAGCTEEIPSVEPIEVQTLTDLKEASLRYFEAEASPNPFVQNINLHLETSKSDRYELRLRDAQGRILWRQRMNLAAGTHELMVPANELKLSDGVYLLEIEGRRGQTKLLKLLKAKP